LKRKFFLRYYVTFAHENMNNCKIHTLLVDLRLVMSVCHSYLTFTL